MGKAVKKVAKVAAVAAAVYFGGKALMGTKAFGSTSFWKGSQTLGMKLSSAASKLGSLYSSSAIQVAGLGLQTTSYLQQRKFAGSQAKATKQAADEQRRINEMQERIRLVQERRQRLDLARQSRIQREQMTAQTASSGLGLSGTSGYLGATGAIQTQATANLTALNQASGASTAISQASQRAADYQSRANMFSAQGTQWAQVGSLGGKLYDKGPEIFDLTKSIFKTG
jgi:hypothetical protein